MKCTGISTGNRHPEDSRTMEQFIGSEQANSSLGKLLIALTEETTWSAGYNVYASFEEEFPYLNISHTTFLSECPLIISHKTGDNWSVRRVEDAVRALLYDSQKSLRSSINILQGRAHNLRQMSEQITVDKAKAAIVAVFPEANSARYHSLATTRGGFYLFTTGAEATPIFVAREIDHEFVGGVARIDCPFSVWYRAEDGILTYQKNGLFWAALARVFAERKLGVKDLLCENVFASEKPLEAIVAQLKVDPYVVEKVIMRIRFWPEGEKVVVEFGSDNLPTKAYMSEPTPQE